jgi:hypothetical protein
MEEADWLKHFTSANSKVRDGVADCTEVGRTNSDFSLEVRQIW